MIRRISVSYRALAAFPRLSIPILAVAVAFAALACGGSSDDAPAASPTSAATATAVPSPTSTPEPAPGVVSATATLSDDNALIASVEGVLDKPGQVYVEYWADGVGRLRTRTHESTGTSFTVPVVRLRADTTYSFQAYGASPGGGKSEGPSGAFETGPLPEVLAASNFETLVGEPTHSLMFMEFRQAGFLGLAAYDKDGSVVWYFAGPNEEQPYVMTRKPNGNILYIAGFKGGTTAMAIVEIDPLGVEQDRLIDECTPFGPIHHEVKVLPDGRVMYLSRDILRPGYGDPVMPQEGDTIGIWDQAAGTNEIVWSALDFIDPSERTVPESNRTLPGFPLWGGCDRDGDVQDWTHADSLSMAEDGSVLIGLRNLDQVVAIAPDFKSILWRLGGPGGEFTFTNPTDKFYRPHSVVALPNGNVLLFDNGNHRPGEEGGEYSRGIELALDMDNMTVRKVWEYRLPGGLFAACCSNVTRLENGNTLVMFGSEFVPEDVRSFPVVEADPRGGAVWVVAHESLGKSSQYRVYPADSIMGEAPVFAQ
jgi:hypothetical protein